VGELSRAFNRMIGGLRERERLRGTLGRYVSGPVAERILAEADDLSLKGELRRITVLFLDVRGFTTMSERLQPAEVLDLLNEYFHIVVDKVQKHRGTVNKFIGDAAMCIWGAPRPLDKPEEAAVLCALEIQHAALALSERRRAAGLVAVGLGIGINAGEAVAGNLGAAQRLEYTVIGDAVNLAQRLESQARAGEILVSQSVRDRVAGRVELVAREPAKLKGKSQPVPLWEVIALKATAGTEAA
jgi:class 3 adenylate cyclase